MNAIVVLAGVLFFAAALGAGAVTTAITYFSLRRIRHQSAEIAQIRTDYRTEIELSEKKCDQRMRYAEVTLSEYAEILRDFASATGRNDIARILAERSSEVAKVLAERAGVTINAGGDANIGGAIAGQDVVNTPGGSQ